MTNSPFIKYDWRSDLCFWVDIQYITISWDDNYWENFYFTSPLTLSEFLSLITSLQGDVVKITVGMSNMVICETK